jgi:Kef-type K+ transport system membrane component KefB
VFGRIRGFTDHLFLFLVGLEIDAAVIRHSARLSVTVGLAGMVFPFGIGVDKVEALGYNCGHCGTVSRCRE